MAGLSQGAYGDIWTYNLQKLDELQNQLSSRLKELEERYGQFDDCYGTIDGIMEVMCSLYSSYNTLDGGKQVRSLMALLRAYRKRLSKEGIDFDLLTGLMGRIEHLRNASFEDFPVLHHDIGPPSATPPHEPSGHDAPPPEIPEKVLASRPCRWITFTRNGSCFIAPFDTVDITECPDAGASVTDRRGVIRVRGESYLVEALDCMAPPGREPAKVHCCITINGAFVYAAHSAGKKIYAKTDFITPRVVPFKTIGENPFSPGRVRLFGKNHILLNNQYIERAMSS